MKVTTRNLPTSQAYALTRRAATSAFKETEVSWLSMGEPPTWSLDEKSFRGVRLSGLVLASAHRSRFGSHRSLHLYAVPKKDLSPRVHGQFRREVIPKIRAWFDARVGLAETAELQHDELIVELTDDELRTHELKAR